MKNIFIKGYDKRVEKNALAFLKIEMEFLIKYIDKKRTNFIGKKIKSPEI